MKLWLCYWNSHFANRIVTVCGPCNYCMTEASWTDLSGSMWPTCLVTSGSIRMQQLWPPSLTGHLPVSATTWNILDCQPCIIISMHILGSLFVPSDLPNKIWKIIKRCFCLCKHKNSLKIILCFKSNIIKYVVSCWLI